MNAGKESTPGSADAMTLPPEMMEAAWRRGLVQQLAALEQAGVRQLPKPSAAGAARLAALAAVQAEAAVADVTAAAILEHEATSEATTDMPPASPDEALKVLSRKVARCTLCSELAATRTQTVFGVGNPQARLCFFGEAPGADEDRLGEPFVGRAGRLLTDIIEKGMKLTRDDVYILNVLKCRPPGNRNPSGEEAENCRQFFERQLEIIQPEFICCLGSIAAQTLLETKESIGRLRGRFHTWRGVQVIATYHPAYLLRNPPAKAQVWEDIQILMKAMGIKPTRQQSAK